MKLKENYIVPYSLIILGFVFMFLPVLTNKTEGSLIGATVILTSLAFMSAKYRRINVTILTAFRAGYELLMILLSFFIVLMTLYQIDDLLMLEFIPLIVWFLVFVGYVALNTGNRENDTIMYKPKDENAIDVSSTEFFGSSSAIALGILYFLSGVNIVAQKTGGSADGLVFGLVVILGALAYKSAKKRKLKLKSNSLIRIGFEITAILLILASVLMANTDIKKFIVETPVSFLIWFWSLLAYLYIVVSSYIKNDPE